MNGRTEELFGTDAGGEAPPERRPLAERMRPQRIEDLVGQEHLLGPGKVLCEAAERGRLFSMVLWGPPGCGKTALARLLAQETRAHWIAFSAVLSGVKEIRAVLQEADHQWARERKQTVLFVDEIHRFNKAQQDAFLPHVEQGTILLIGATTENPSFEVNKALLSRTRVLVLRSLGHEAIARIVRRALQDRKVGLGNLELRMDDAAMDFLCRSADGDARRALNALEVAAGLLGDSGTEGRVLTLALMEEAFQRKSVYHDKSGEEHYNRISAFIKSLRGSDPDAALYWMVCMLDGGEDPLFIVRRLVIFASEDVGNADPMALSLAVAAQSAVHFVGLPEAALTLAQAVTYLATAPKSNASCRALAEAQKALREHGALPVPLSLRNAPTRLMKDLGYGRGYRYPHDAPGAFVDGDYLPDVLRGKVFYAPTDRGHEQRIRDRLAAWRARKSRR